MSGPTGKRPDIERLRANYADELEGAALYRALADAEKDPAAKDVFTRLASVEEAHSAFWAKKIGDLGEKLPRTRPGFRTRALSFLARRFGPAFVLPTIMGAEVRDSNRYANQPDAVAAGLAATEREHAAALASIQSAKPARKTRAQPMSGAEIARLEGRRHNLQGNALRAAVLGANDGLVSNMSLVMGVAGAALDSHTILLTGIAGLIAGACSMALGEWLSVNSSREMFEHQIALEAEELANSPEEERNELVLIYRAKGLPEDQAKALADKLMSDQSSALDTLAREELGINPEDLGGSAWTAAGTSFLLFAIGAIIPVAPFFVLTGGSAIVASIVCSALGLFGIGIVTSLFTARSALYSGVRQFVIGLVAAGITYGIGKLAGATIS
ncbi:MAG: rubrerythrin family protein [Alphaproteobacteria bacterium]|nr:rubrerythrin family protein [Alphaproteobacteria bacterium]